MAFDYLLFILLLITNPLTLVNCQLSQCGMTCINNELGLAPALGCSSSDAACLCNNPDFGYGIRDCANEACGSDAPAVIAYGVSYCNSALSSTTLASSTSTATVLPSDVSSTIHSLSTSTRSPSSPIASPTNSPTNPPKNNNSTDGSPLSTGAKAGLGVGVVIGFLILCLLIYIASLLHRRHRREQMVAQRTSENLPPELGPGLLPEMAVVEKPRELSAEGKGVSKMKKAEEANGVGRVSDPRELQG